MIVKIIIFFLIYICVEIQSAKILAVFPVPSISHQVVFRRITLELVNRGHEVTVITPDPAYPKGESPLNLTEIDVHDVSYAAWSDLMAYTASLRNVKLSKFEEIRGGSLMLSSILKIQMDTPEVQDLISRKQNFDLLLIEATILPALVFSHIFKAPVILLSSLGAIFNSQDLMGMPTHPLLYPSFLNKKIYNLTVFEKIYEIYCYIETQYAFYLNEADESAMLRQLLGPDVPNMRELYDNVDMFFINLHPIWANNQPIPPGVVYMGGIHQLPERDLPKDLKIYLDSSKQGVIYVSFGTNVLSGMIPSNKVEIMSKVLSKLPYNVLWKWDKDELPGKSDNINISKWLPQSDLLRHPNIKLFITQAGLQSTDEAISAGVPLVAIPMLGDQWYNAEKYVKHGIGIKLDIETLNEENFKEAVETAINNTRYRENVIKLRNFMRDQPETPLQRTMWWIEYVLRNKGAKQLRAPAANISLYEYLVIDALLVVLLITLVILGILVKICFIIFNLVNQFSVTSKTSKRNKTD